MNKFLFLIHVLSFTYVVNAQNIYTFAGTGNFGYSGDGGPAILADITSPTGIVTDKKGNVYFCEWYYGLIKKVDSNGIITTIAGGLMANLADSIPATNALVRHPWGLTIDSVGNLYFAEAQYNQVRKIDTNGIITTIAGAPYQVYQGQGYYSGDGGPAKNAGLYFPSDVAIDKYGNIYIADAGNNRIRVVDKNGIITTFAGGNGPGFSGDGGLAVNAKFNNPLGIATDKFNNIYIGDAVNNRIRKIDNLGIITTVVGTGIQGNSGDGGLAINADMGSTRGLEVDSLGNLIFGDREYGVVRKVDSNGIISKLAGTGIGGGYSGDGGPATSAQLYSPMDVTFDKFGNLYISDDLRVRKVCYNSCIAGLNSFEKQSEIKIYPNPATHVIQIMSDDKMSLKTKIDILNNLGQVVITQDYSDSIDISKLPTGVYTLKITSAKSGDMYKKFIIQH
ncbi:MAG: T9SS type A sorting domain-containing protein [Bacteroidia bacterium]|nr:T9SS type A sorting domain-containing protein [Bacteroidia bacterium]